MHGGAIEIFNKKLDNLNNLFMHEMTVFIRKKSIFLRLA